MRYKINFNVRSIETDAENETEAKKYALKESRKDIEIREINTEYKLQRFSNCFLIFLSMIANLSIFMMCAGLWIIITRLLSAELIKLPAIFIISYIIGGLFFLAKILSIRWFPFRSLR